MKHLKSAFASADTPIRDCRFTTLSIMPSIARSCRQHGFFHVVHFLQFFCTHVHHALLSSRFHVLHVFLLPYNFNLLNRGPYQTPRLSQSTACLFYPSSFIISTTTSTANIAFSPHVLALPPRPPGSSRQSHSSPSSRLPHSPPPLRGKWGRLTSTKIVVSDTSGSSAASTTYAMFVSSAAFTTSAE